jgi:hypothetical protein
MYDYAVRHADGETSKYCQTQTPQPDLYSSDPANQRGVFMSGINGINLRVSE